MYNKTEFFLRLYATRKIGGKITEKYKPLLINGKSISKMSVTGTYKTNIRVFQFIDWRLNNNIGFMFCLRIEMLHFIFDGVIISLVEKRLVSKHSVKLKDRKLEKMVRSKK